MKKLLGILLGAALGFALADQKPKPPPLFDEIAGICRDLESITGLKFRHPVPSAVIDKTQLRKFLDSRVDKAMKPADVKAESLTLKMLGLIPQDFDLKQQTVDLLTEQAAAFYDYKKKKLFLLSGDNDENSIMALAHELAHALADQNFHLNKYIRQNESDDAATARMAVMEGQATWLMSAYLHVRAGLGPDVPEPILKMMSDTVDSGASQYPVYSQSPRYIRDSLVFPYKAGMLFQDAVFRKIGKAGFAQVFERAPVSTQQIMHPAKYLDGEAPVLPEEPEIPHQKSFAKLAEGTLGEFDVRVLIEEFDQAKKADSLCPAFQGSHFALYENKKQKYPVLAFRMKWATPAAAEEFLAFYRQAIEKKAQGFKLDKDSASQVTGSNQMGWFRLSLAGTTVESVEGLKSSLN